MWGKACGTILITLEIWEIDQIPTISSPGTGYEESLQWQPQKISFHPWKEISSTNYQANPLGPRPSGRTCLFSKACSRELTLKGLQSRRRIPCSKRGRIAEALVSIWCCQEVNTRWYNLQERKITSNWRLG